MKHGKSSTKSDKGHDLTSDEEDYSELEGHDKQEFESDYEQESNYDLEESDEESYKWREKDNNEYDTEDEDYSELESSSGLESGSSPKNRPLSRKKSLISDENPDLDLPIVYHSLEVKKPEFNVSDEEWNWAERQQHIKQEKKESGFKIRRKGEEARKHITHSFVSISPESKQFFSCTNPQSHQQELYCLAPKGQLLGKGTYGKVKLAKNREGDYVAVKIQMTPEEGSKRAASQQYERDIMQEIGIYHGGMKRTSKKDKKEYHVIKYLGIALKDLITTNEINKITPEERYKIGIGILKALQDLHERNILHCDLHTGNILIEINEKTGKVNISLIDFGFAKKLGSEQEVAIPEGTIANLRILPPEIYNSVKHQRGSHPYYSKQSDIFAAGLVLQKLGFGSLIDDAQLLQRDPAKRPTAEDALDFLRANKRAVTSEIERSDKLSKKYRK